MSAWVTDDTQASVLALQYAWARCSITDVLVFRIKLLPKAPPRQPSLPLSLPPFLPPSALAVIRVVRDIHLPSTIKHDTRLFIHSASVNATRSSKMSQAAKVMGVLKTVLPVLGTLQVLLACLYANAGFQEQVTLL